MRKRDIHPKYFEEAKVFCNGEEVLTTSGTMPEYKVDIWSGNHPFFNGNSAIMVLDEGRVNRFKRRFDGLGSLSDIATLTNAGGGGSSEPAKMLPMPEKAAGKVKGKGKKK